MLFIIIGILVILVIAKPRKSISAIEMITDAI